MNSQRDLSRTFRVHSDTFREFKTKIALEGYSKNNRDYCEAHGMVNQQRKGSLKSK